MNKTSTQTNLLLYIYNELSEKEANEIKELINYDNKIKAEYNKLVKALNMIDKINSKPSKRVYENILDYCKTNSNYMSKQVGEIDISLN